MTRGALLCAGFCALSLPDSAWASAIAQPTPSLEPSAETLVQNDVSKMELGTLALSPPESSQIATPVQSVVQFSNSKEVLTTFTSDLSTSDLSTSDLPEFSHAQFSTIDLALDPQPETTEPERSPTSDSPTPPEPAADSGMTQLPLVTQLTDVQPTDWAYQALQSLVEQYGCIVGYPDRTFQGNRSLSRYEFAAGLSACLDRINAQLDEATSNHATRADLDIISRLQTDFAPELASLRGRVDALEARTATLEAQAFSTTTILGGEVILGLADGFGGGPPGDGDVNTVFGYFTNLQLVTSFNGKDRLRLELQSGNFGGGEGGFASPSAFNSQGALFSFQQDTQNQLSLGDLEYRFSALNDRAVFTVQPVGFSLSSVLTSNSPFFSDSQGSLSRFGQLSPLLRIGNPDSGVGVDLFLNRRLRFQAAYGTSDAGNPQSGFVFGKGGYVLGGQFLILPTNHLQLGLSYITGYTPDGRLNTFTGSRIADASGFIDQPAQIHAFNTTLQWEISPKVTLSTWAGAALTYASQTNGGAVSTTYAASLGIRDPFSREQGDLLGVIFGQPLSLLEVSGFQGSTGAVTDGASSFHAELFYRFRVNDYLSITPGVFMVTHPGNFEDNNTIYVGAVRTSLRF